MGSEFAAVVRECKRWGVPLVWHAQRREFESLRCQSPTGQGAIEVRTDGPWRLHWSTQREDARAPLSAAELLHELIHIAVGIHPTEVDEVESPMLYLEWHTARRLRLTAWTEWMTDYGLPRGATSYRASHPTRRFDSTWGDASTHERHFWLTASREAAFAVHLVDTHGRPTYRKTP